MYCTTFPCVICLKMIINAGLTRVYYLEGYADEIAKQIIAEADFPVLQLEDTEIRSGVADHAGRHDAGQPGDDPPAF